MRRKIVLMIAYILAINGAIYAFDDGDFQIWHSESQEKKFNRDTKVTLEEEFRFGDDANDFYYHHYDAGLVRSANKNLDLAINYRQVYEKKEGRV